MHMHMYLYMYLYLHMNMFKHCCSWRDKCGSSCVTPRLQSLNETVTGCHVSTSEFHSYDMLLARVTCNGRRQARHRLVLNFGWASARLVKCSFELWKCLRRILEGDSSTAPQAFYVFMPSFFKSAGLIATFSRAVHGIIGGSGSQVSWIHRS